jgi:hypothetical protein
VIDRRPRAAVVLAEAAPLGLQLDGLIAAQIAPSRRRSPTISTPSPPTFSPGTATSRSYWRLALHHLGDRQLSDTTVLDLRPGRSRPAATGATQRAV